MRSVHDRHSGLWKLLLCWPIRRKDQLVFAESLAEALTAGIEVTKAIDLAAKVNPSRRFRHALRQVRQDVSAGYQLAVSLARSGARVMPELSAALKVGEGHGKLAEELFAYARTVNPQAAKWLRQAVGRRQEATRFAAALSRLLRDEGLTEDIVADAGSVAAAGSRRFLEVIGEIVAEMDRGGGFAEALSHHPRYFDRLYCGLLQAANSRSRLRLCLERLSAGQ